MPPVSAGTAAPDSGTGSIAANDGDGDLHGEQSKPVAISGDGLAPNVAKKMKRSVEGLKTSRPATADDAGGGDDVSPRLRRRRRRRRLLEIKKRGVEVEEQMLALEERRLRWAAADAEARREEGEEDAELEKMRVENGVARAENARLWRRLLRRRRERELGVGGVRSNKCRDGAVAMEGEEKPVP